MLIAEGASLEARDINGNTPLLGAVLQSRGNGAVIKELRQRGADPHAENNHGVSPVSLARNIGNFPVAQFFADLP
jgi:ankyrin repeat protein